MSSYKLYISYLLLIAQTFSIYAQELGKSSLTFVIDESGSMQYEIDEVKKKIDTIFDSALKTSDPLIKNFVVVTFNDPEVELRTITTDRDELKSALEGIQVRGGGDCPEASLMGISYALEYSLPYSSVFVFTDASAKDYKMFEEVKAVAEEKKIRIFFILTGNCRGIYEDSYQVYYRLANATTGQVFNVKKSEVNDIVPIVIQNIRSRRHILVPVKHPKIYSKKFTFTVYKQTDEVFIFIRGQTPKIQIVDAQDRNIKTTQNDSIKGVLVVKVQGQRPGIYAAEVTSTSEVSVQFLGSTTVNFLDEKF